MTDNASPLGPIVDELANALQASVLLAESLQLAASASAHDSAALARSLDRKSVV